MADGNVVGSIKVRVKPDLERFREELEAKLEAIEDSLVGELDFNGNFKRLRSQAAAAVRNMPEAEIDADLNTAGLAAQARAALAGAGASLDVDTQFRKDSLRDLMGTLNSARASLDKTFRDAAQGLIVKIGTQVDPNARAAWRDEIESELAAMQAVAFRVEPKLDSDFGDRLRARMSLERIPIKLDYPRLERYNKYKIDLDTSVAQAQAQAWRARQAAEKITIPLKVKPDPDLTGFAALKARLDAMFENININIRTKKLTAADLLPNAGDLKEAASGITKVGSSAALAGPSLFSFRGFVLAAGVAIALLLPPLLALIAGLTVLLPGAIAAVLTPIGAIALGVEGIKNAAKSVQPEFDALRQKMADTFEKGLPGMTGLTEQFQRLKSEFFPALNQELPKVAQGLNELFKGVVDSISSGPGLANIRNIIDNVGVGLANAAPGVKSFTDGILQLISSISEKFPGLGTKITELGGKFAEWATEFTTEKQENGLTRLEQLIENIKGALKEIGGLFGDAFSQGLKDISDPSFGQNMQDFFSKVRTFVRETLPVLSQGFETFSKTLDTLVAPIEKLINAWDKLTNLPGVKQGLDFLGTITGMKQAKGIADALGSEISGDDATGPFKNIPKQAAEAGKQATAQFQQTGEQIGQSLSQGITGMVTGAGAGNATNELQGVLNSQMQQLATGIQQQMTNLGPQLQASFEVLKGSLDTGFGVLFLSLTAKAQQIKDGIAQAFTGISEPIAAALGDAVTAAAGKGQQIRDSVVNPVREIPAQVQTAFDTLSTSITTAMDNAVKSVQTGVQQIVAECEQIGSKVSGAVGDLSGTLQPAGQQLAAGLRAGLESGMAGVLDYARTIAGQIAAVKGPLPKDRKELVPAGIALMDGLNAGMENGMVSVLDNAKAMAKSIFEAFKEVFGTSPNLTLNFNGMGAGFSAADTQLQKLNTTVSTFKDNIQTTPLLGTDSNTSGPALSKSEAKKQIDALSQSLLELEMQRKNLQLQKDAVGGDKAARAAIQAQINQISNQKTQLGLQKDQLNYAMKYGGVVDDTQNSYKSLVDSLLRAPVDIGQTIASSVMGDLGMSGQGAIPQLFQQGINYVFQVANMDDALGAQQVLQNRQSIGMVGR